MPRIDPIQLLKCISVLLSPSGGIKSTDEVQRLAGLMTKYSKKLVSKCIYIQILKCTETELLGLFMGSGGWRLVHMWLTESIVSKNWPLIQELLELLLLCPVDIERLKTNNCPKIVKELSKENDYLAIRTLASKLVEQWLRTVKGENVTPISLKDIPLILGEPNTPKAVIDPNGVIKSETVSKESVVPVNDLSVVNEDVQIIETKKEEVVNTIIIDDSNKKVETETETIPVLKIKVKGGKQIITQIEDSDKKGSERSSSSKDKDRSNKHRSSKHSRSSSSSSDSKKSSSKHSSKSHSSSSSDRHRNSSSHRSSSSSSKHSSSSRDKSRDTSKHSSHSSKSKSDESSNSSSNKHKDKHSRSSSSDKGDKHEKSNKDQSKKEHLKKDETIPLQPSISKVGKIPKLSSAKNDKHSISIEVRKPDDPKPKTVKTFNSKFRKHGLDEEIKPPPSRSSILTKKTPSTSVPKRSSPIRNESAPPEKKIKTLDPVEKPGAIKLIPAKPKPMMLLESDMFMDALNAATNKKDSKKRKRRTSVSKDGTTLSDSSPPQTPTATSPNTHKSVPPRFYQDTLETDDTKYKQNDESSESNLDKGPESPDDSVNEPVTLTINGLKGVLCYHKKKGPKKSIRWKIDLEEIQYFELDETERVNVTKPFTDMKYLERIHEREAFQKGRNLSTDDVMEEKTTWRPLIPIDCDDQIKVDYGKGSKEKEIQAIRQKGTLQPLYFHKKMIPDSPLEPDIETHTYSEPNIIPLEDFAGGQDNVTDFRNMPWPEPKGNPPTTTASVPTMFQPPMQQFPNNFSNPQFGMPNMVQAPNMIPPAEWQNGMSTMMASAMIAPPGGMMPGAMAPGPIPAPGMMMPPENMMMNPEMFNAPNGHMYPPMQQENYNMMDNMNMQQNMFPPNYNMQDSGQNFRGAMRGRGVAGHWRGNSNWEGPNRGRGGHARGGNKAVCMYFQRKGSCRQGDNCSFLHTNANRPY